MDKRHRWLLVIFLAFITTVALYLAFYMNNSVQTTTYERKELPQPGDQAVALHQHNAWWPFGARDIKLVSQTRQDEWYTFRWDWNNRTYTFLVHRQDPYTNISVESMTVLP